MECERHRLSSFQSIPPGRMSLFDKMNPGHFGDKNFQLIQSKNRPKAILVPNSIGGY